MINLNSSADLHRLDLKARKLRAEFMKSFFARLRRR